MTNTNRNFADDAPIADIKFYNRINNLCDMEEFDRIFSLRKEINEWYSRNSNYKESEYLKGNVNLLSITFYGDKIID